MKVFKYIFLIGIAVLQFNLSNAQLVYIKLSKKALSVEEFETANNQSYQLDVPLPIVSLEICPVKNSDQNQVFNITTSNGNRYVKCDFKFYDYKPGVKGVVTFRNISKDTIRVRNIVPFGKDTNHVYITGYGENYLQRAHLFRPNARPVNIILPDNAWELGYGQRTLNGDVNVCAITRRSKESLKDGKISRFETVLYPKGEISYTLYADIYTGEWQNGLRLMFQDRMIYDVEPGTFDNSLFEREDLKWVRHSYFNQSIMVWDKKFYSPDHNKYELKNTVKNDLETFDGADYYTIWPTWPQLGIDQSNQWDQFRNLKGGIDSLRDITQFIHDQNLRFYIAFKPWDTSTREENVYVGLSKLIKEIDADGVVMDCMGASNEELRQAADTYKKGVVMYSEGMAVPKDMQGIVSGRVHDALTHIPMLNMNKLIKPDFALFRVIKSRKEDGITRDFNLALFNGHGVEINYFGPGIQFEYEKDMKYLAKVLMFQRENSHNFTSFKWNPLIPTTMDNVYVNHWPLAEKEIYTIYSVLPEGVYAPLFEAKADNDFHYIDLWNHEKAKVENKNGKDYVVADIDAFSKKYLDTNKESSIGIVARFKKHLNADFNVEADLLTFSADSGDRIKIWMQNPAYSASCKEFSIEKQTIKMLDVFGRVENKIIVQLFKNDQLIDENVIKFKRASARKISKENRTKSYTSTPEGMVKIKAGTFKMQVYDSDHFISYPNQINNQEVTVRQFYMDKFPVTNAQFKKFIDATNYQPKGDTENFLRHWKNGKISKGDENKPVVYVSYEDAQAYAKWAEKRLPTEIEWQYAAQAGDSERDWPWGEDKSIETEDISVTPDLVVKTIKNIDERYCNPGNGIYEDIGQHPAGENPWGLQDLVGSVWQLTNDVYDNTSYKYLILKGGSYYKAKDSWWYVQGGAQNLKFRQMQLRVSKSFERRATIGFRCVADCK